MGLLKETKNVLAALVSIVKTCDAFIAGVDVLSATDWKIILFVV